MDADDVQAAGALPPDLGAAHALITQLLQQVDAREQQIESKQHEIDSKQQQIDQLQHLLSVLRRYVFGRRSEKAAPVVAEQGVLSFAAAAGEVGSAASDEHSAETVEVRGHQRKSHPGRKPLPADLPVEIVEITPADADLICTGCEQQKHRIGVDTTQTLDYRPASFFIRAYVRPKYACPRCQQGVLQAALPARPIEKGRPEPGVLAHVVTSKYADHLPLYRIEQIFARHGIAVSRGLLSQWNGAVADLLTPLAEAIHQQILHSRWIQSDDTTVTVQEAERVYVHLIAPLVAVHPHVPTTSTGIATRRVRRGCWRATAATCRWMRPRRTMTSSPARHRSSRWAAGRTRGATSRRRS